VKGIIKIMVGIRDGEDMQKIFQDIKNTATTVSVYILTLIICD
jgi:hypothetical protein